MNITVVARRRHYNSLLSRREILLDVLHPLVPCYSHKDVKSAVSKKFKADQRSIVLFGFKTHFGGGRTTGFCFIYDNMNALVKIQPKHRLRRLQILPKRNPVRKAQKQLKKKIKKTRAGQRRKVLAQRKKQTPRQVKLAKQNYLKTIGL